MTRVVEPQMLDEKDPAENIPVVFDFTKLTDTVASPVVTCVRKRGAADSTPSAMISGAATVAGAVVTQKIIGGVALADYTLRCEVTSGTYKYALTAILPVRTA